MARQLSSVFGPPSSSYSKFFGVFERDKVGRRGCSYKVVFAHPAILLTKTFLRVVARTGVYHPSYTS
jgi:hypothetical protein